MISPTVEALSRWLDTAPNSERSGDFRSIRLERIAAFCRSLPPAPAPLSVVGTKGKGSTVRLVEAALVAGGYRTLAFTSPHVSSLLERWRCDGKPAQISAVVAAANEVAAREGAVGGLSWFERSWAIAWLLAGSRPGTLFLAEAGLGGRLDCVNATDAAVVALTHLSHDHREVLGPTLRHIAHEKLAVARPGRPLVIAPQSPAAREAITAKLPPGVTAVWVTAPAIPLPLALLGAHQQDNAATALAVLRHLAPSLDPRTALAGMATATLAARCQLVPTSERTFLIDGAHNGPSVAATLAVAQARLIPGWTLVLGLATDKEVDEILAVIPAGTRVLRCGYVSPRARSRLQWPSAALDWPWFERFADAMPNLPPGDVCVTGSFYLAGEVLGIIDGSTINRAQ